MERRGSWVDDPNTHSAHAVPVEHNVEETTQVECFTDLRLQDVDGNGEAAPRRTLHPSASGGITNPVRYVPYLCSFVLFPLGDSKA